MQPITPMTTWGRACFTRLSSPSREKTFSSAFSRMAQVLRRMRSASAGESVSSYRRSAVSNPALAARYPLALITPPARNFLNTSFVNLPRFREQEGGPRLQIHPDDAAARGLTDGTRVRVHNDRGEFHARAVLTTDVRCGVVVSPSVWWQKLSGDGENANAVTSSAPTDMGGGPTFYDTLVEVRAAD